MLLSCLDKLADSLPTFRPTYLAAFTAYFTVEFFSMGLGCSQSTFPTCLFNRHFTLFSGQLVHLPKNARKTRFLPRVKQKIILKNMGFYSSSRSLPAWISFRTLCPPLCPASSRLVFPIASLVPSCCLALSDPPLLPISL
jgi:hypothetical protein